MKFVFIIDYLFSSPASANAVCTMKLVNSLKTEHEIYCITLDREKADDSNIKIDGVQYIRLKKRAQFQFIKVFNKVSQYNKVLGYIVKSIGRLFIAIKNLFYLPIWPIYSIKTPNRICRIITQLIVKNGVNCVFGACFPGEALSALIKIKKKHPNIKTISFFMDVFTTGMLNQRKWLRLITKATSKTLEERLLNSIDRCICLENTKSYYLSRYPQYKDKIYFAGLPLIENKAVHCLFNKNHNQIINFAYVGALIKTEREPFLLLKNIRETMGELPYRVNFYGKESGLLTSLPKEILENYRIVYHGVVSETEANKVMSECDILLNIGNIESLLIPSKIFRYIASGKKIIHFQQIQNDPCLKPLSLYPCSYIINPKTVLEKEKFKVFIYEYMDKQINLEVLYPKYFPEYTTNILFQELGKEEVIK